MTTQPPSILLVDDHAVIAAPLTMALAASGLGRVVAMDTSDLSVEAVVATARAEKPDIVLLDLNLGGGRLGLPMIEPLSQLGAKVALFTASSDRILLATGVRAGALAVLDKAMPFNLLVAALFDLAAGRSVMPAEQRDALLASLDAQHTAVADAHRPFSALTEREAHVLRLLIRGDSPKHIARAEGLSVSTVRGHIQRVLSKLDVSSQREALALARAAQWPGDA